MVAQAQKTKVSTGKVSPEAEIVPFNGLSLFETILSSSFGVEKKSLIE